MNNSDSSIRSLWAMAAAFFCSVIVMSSGLAMFAAQGNFA